MHMFRLSDVADNAPVAVSSMKEAPLPCGEPTRRQRQLSPAKPSAVMDTQVAPAAGLQADTATSYFVAVAVKGPSS